MSSPRPSPAYGRGPPLYRSAAINASAPIARIGTGEVVSASARPATAADGERRERRRQHRTRRRRSARDEPRRPEPLGGVDAAHPVERVVREVHADLQRGGHDERGGELPLPQARARGGAADDDGRDAGDRACAGAPRATRRARSSRPLREPREVGRALLHVRVAALLRLLAHVVEERGVAGELLHAGEAVDGRVRTGLQQPERERDSASISRHHATVVVLELVERDDRVDEPPRERGLGVVLAAQEPDLLRALLADLASEQRDPVAAVERADARPGLSEPGVVGGDREVAADVQDVAAADRVARRPSRRPAWACAGSGPGGPGRSAGRCRPRRRTRRRRGSAGRRRC